MTRVARGNSHAFCKIVPSLMQEVLLSVNEWDANYHHKCQNDSAIRFSSASVNLVGRPNDAFSIGISSRLDIIILWSMFSTASTLFVESTLKLSTFVNKLEGAYSGRVFVYGSPKSLFAFLIMRFCHNSSCESHITKCSPQCRNVFF